jgi:cell pole-organizing protein PopZ
MEDILASIRRILSEDEGEQAAAASPPPPPEPPAGPSSDVLALDPSMLVEEPPAAPPPLPAMAPMPPIAAPQVEPPPPVPPAARAPEPPPPPSAPPPAAPPIEPGPAFDALLGPEATAAAASSMASLLRTLVAERQQVAVYRGGPTLEDLAREEIRSLLKQWLDANLPTLVERLVRAEIERVVGRAVA